MQQPIIEIPVEIFSNGEVNSITIDYKIIA